MKANCIYWGSMLKGLDVGKYIGLYLFLDKKNNNCISTETILGKNIYWFSAMQFYKDEELSNMFQNNVSLEQITSFAENKKYLDIDQEIEKQEIVRKFSDIIHEKQILNSKLSELTKQAIFDYNFLDHKISEFWKCEKSPIGLCVFMRENGIFHNDCICRYCNQPNERK